MPASGKNSNPGVTVGKKSPMLLYEIINAVISGIVSSVCSFSLNKKGVFPSFGEFITNLSIAIIFGTAIYFGIKLVFRFLRSDNDKNIENVENSENGKNSKNSLLLLFIIILIVFIAIYGIKALILKNGDSVMGDPTVEATETIIPTTEEPTLTPTVEVVAATEVPTIQPTSVWEFKEICGGCLPDDWVYWPDVRWQSKIEQDSTLRCDENSIDLSYFGIKPIMDKGLSFVFQADGFYTFGISREVPKNLTFFEIELKLYEIVSTTNEDIEFMIGFIDTTNENEGENFLYVKNANNGNSILLYKDDPIATNERAIGYLDEYVGPVDNRYLQILISCEVSENQTMTCDYNWSNTSGSYLYNKKIVLPRLWDSIYIGYSIPNDGFLKLTISEFQFVFSE